MLTALLCGIDSLDPFRVGLIDALMNLLSAVIRSREVSVSA